MFKNTYKKIFAFITLFMAFLSVNVFADEIDNLDKKENKQIEKNQYEEYAIFCYNTPITKLDEQQQITSLEKANKIISELMTTLKDKVTSLDERVEYIRTTGEYDNYPAIRLNLDTPIFGINSIIEQKLKISKDVSPNDIASSYSIRSIVKNSYIKLPESYIAGILISTYEVDLKNDVNLSNANMIILKLTQYINKVDEIEEFLDNQVSRFFRGYIEKEKLSSISDIESRISRQIQELQNINEIIIKLELLESNNEKYIEYSNEYINLLNRLLDLKEKNSDTLMDSNILNEYKKEIINIESDILNFTTKVKSSKIKNEDMSDDDILTMLNNTKINIEKIKENIEGFVNNSTYEKEVELSSEEVKDIDNSIFNNIEEKTEEDKIKEESSTEQIKLYEITNESVISNFDNYLSELDNMIKKIEDKIAEENKNKQENNFSNEVTNNTENEKIDNTISEEELNTKIEMLTNMLKLYKEALSKENKFYLNNINNTLKKVTSKISDLSRYTECDIYDSVKYIYIDIPVNLDNYINRVDNSYTSQINLNDSLKNELDKMIKTYINANIIYQKMQIDDLKQND